MEACCPATPRSHHDDVPLAVSEQDRAMLEDSTAFQILRHHLAQHCVYEYCDAHRASGTTHGETWTLNRDVLHALLVPIVELFNKANSLAECGTCSYQPEDREFAYTGEARGAFLWLQCFLADEADWCVTKGCPACVVSHALDTEFTIRLSFAACLLSDMHDGSDSGRLALPSFITFVEPLRCALTNDPFWGPGSFDHLERKASTLRHGILALMEQCSDLETLVASPTTPQYDDSTCPTASCHSPSYKRYAGAPVKRSRFAKRQIKLMEEEEQWVQKMLSACSKMLAANSAVGIPRRMVTGHELEGPRGRTRKRSLTTP
ncbi:hypothetical protein LTR50_007402 [Elasticomyces elasticus]|nr:hypothetical protein LTR50_007402 [Elasticomyces elasticus]